MDIHNLTQTEKKEQRKQHLRFDFPNSYGISLGEYPCNHSCRMCPMYNEPVKKENARYISDEIFELACDAVGNRKVSLEISSYGETFQHPNADNYMFVARKKAPNSEIVVATNGSLLDEERCRKIVDSGIDHLSFSMDAGSPETHEWLTGSKKYDKIANNLETLVNIRNKANAKHLKISTHIIGVKELEHEFDRFVDQWKEIVDHAYVRNYGNWAGMVDNNGVTPATKQNIPNERYPCAWLWYATKIEPNGDVSKCFIHVTGDKSPLGNITKQSFESIWQGEKMKAVRELHLTNRYDEVEHCSNCIVWSLFPNFWDKTNDKWSES